jgi:hypothetical protein
MLRSQGCLQEDEDQMVAKGKIHLVPLRISWNAAMQFSVIICLLAAIQSPLIDCAEASQEDLLDRIAASPDPTSPIVNSSLNGYSSSHPILFYSPIASRTQVLSKGSPSASLHHSVQSAHEISGSSEYIVSERSYQEGDSTRISSNSIGMRIDETVTEGKVSIGAFQADLSSQDGTDLESSRKKSNPWRNPALMIEEEYIGTFHISRNMTIKSNYIIQGEKYRWLGYDSVYLSFIPSKPVSISADEVFKCLKCS